MRFLILFLAVFLFADVNQILYKIAVKNDLSNKTKRENSGILYLLTREDICALQINHLKDLFKILPIGYKFNRYGIVDNFNPNTNIPFLSSTIKVFIDNQEIVSGFYNSGLAILGDLDLGWVDHIEVYTQAPSYDITNEPSLIVIRLFSKRADRDEGNNIYLSKAIKGSYIYFEKAKNLKVPYYFYISNDIEKSSYHNSKYSKQALLNIYNDTSNFLMNFIANKYDGFLGFSLDGNVDDSYIKNKFFHMGYEKKFNNFKFYIAFSANKNHTYYYETPLLFILKNIPIQKVDVVSFDRVIDVNLKYKKDIDKNILLFGIKNRFKYFNWDTLKFNDIDWPQTNRDKQNVHTAFFQISRFLKRNSLINFGYSFSFYKNNGGMIDQKTRQYRLSHTFSKNKFTFKTVFSHIEYTIDPYLMNSIFVSKNILKPAKINNFFENIKFETFLHSFELNFGYFVSKDYFFPNDEGLLDNSNKRINETYFGFSYEYRYEPFSKFSFRYFFQYLRDIPKINIYRAHKAVLFNYNDLKKYSFFEELIIDKQEGTKFYYDLSLGAKYHKNDNLTFFIKGENLLNRADEYDFLIFDPITHKSGFKRVPFIERNVMAGLEYSF